MVRSVYASGSLDHKVHYYYNDRWQLLEEFIEVSGTVNEHPQSSYLWHPYYIDALALRLYDESVDGNAGTQYYLHDANYNVTSVWDGSQALERYSYSPYGEVTFLNPDYSTKSSQTTGIGNTHLYTGRERDSETGLQLNRHRFYSSWLGRWVNRDPADYAGSRWNLYEYVQSKPLAYVDAMGERCIRCTCKSRNGRRTWTSDVDCNFTGTNKTYMDCCKEKRACWHGKDDGPPYGFGDAVGAEPCENPPTNYCRLHPEDCGKEAVFVAALSACCFLAVPACISACKSGPEACKSCVLSAGGPVWCCLSLPNAITAYQSCLNKSIK